METLSRAAIIREARSWLGTSYCHQASVKGEGCDCLGLVRGVWRALIGPEPIVAPPYTPDWADCADGEALVMAVRSVMTDVAIEQAAPGDVLLFRMRIDAPAKHAAILCAPDAIIHAYWGRAVVESRLAPWWRARLAHAFRFPGVAAWPS